MSFINRNISLWDTFAGLLDRGAVRPTSNSNSTKKFGIKSQSYYINVCVRMCIYLLSL